MAEKQPTQEQIKELWEWCGLDLKHKFEPCGIGNLKTCIRCGGVYPNPVGKYCSMPSLDLNNLFKYVVSKLDNIKLVKNMAPSGDVFWNGTAEYIPNVKVVTHEDPALALFWAIWEVIHNGRE